MFPNMTDTIRSSMVIASMILNKAVEVFSRMRSPMDKSSEIIFSLKGKDTPTGIISQIVLTKEQGRPVLFRTALWRVYITRFLRNDLVVSV